MYSPVRRLPQKPDTRIAWSKEDVGNSEDGRDRCPECDDREPGQPRRQTRFPILIT